MNGSIIASVLYVTGFLLCYAEIFLFPKSDKKLNGVMWLLLSLLAEMCWGGLTAGIINIIHIPINLYSMGVVHLLSAVLLAVKIHRGKERQQYRWSWLDILFSLSVFVLVAFVVFRKAGPDMQLIFINSDAAVHLKNAVSLVLEQKLPVMYFAPFQLGMILEVAMPFLPIYEFYKVFIIVDAVFFAVEIIFFFQFCREYLRTWRMKALGIVMCVLYAAGYPLLSYLFSFYYWAIGVMLIGFAALLLRMYRRREVKRQYLVFLLMLCCNGVVMCYMLIAPMAFIAVFFGLAAIVKDEGRLFAKGNILLALKVFLIPTLLAVYYCYFEFLSKEGMSATDVISIDGGIYRELYVNFLFLMPVVAYMVFRAIHKKKADENMIFFGTICIFVLVLFVFAGLKKVSGYYFYKFYYPLWFFAFVLAIQGIAKLLEEQWEILAGYGLMFAFLFVMHYGGLEQLVVLSKAGFQEEYRSGEFFSLYDYNLSYLKLTGSTFPDDYMEVCKYVVDELEGQENVPLIAAHENYDKCFWYEAITGNDCSEYYGWKHNFEEVRKKLDNQETDYFAVFKDSGIFEENKTYFNAFDVIYQNETAVVYSTRK
ncbi:hypothetical protein D3Z36_05330 [Lachnospiraceae bacterium]|nr:hypothetical protein [Lachnospiraceae bacterium]